MMFLWGLLGLVPSVTVGLCWLLFVRPRSVAMPMLGMRSRRREHGMLNLGKWTSARDCLRSKKLIDMWKSVRRVHRKMEISVKCERRRWLSWEHVLVIYDHEKRYISNPIAALTVTISRYFYFYFCYGENELVDEFRVDGVLVSFGAAVVKGQTIRNMWFYCKSEATKLCLFYHVIQLAIERAYRLNLKYVDLGPSSGAMRTTKEKLGFEFHREYFEGYVGAFKDVPDMKIEVFE